MVLNPRALTDMYTGQNTY